MRIDAHLMRISKNWRMANPSADGIPASLMTLPWQLKRPLTAASHACSNISYHCSEMLKNCVKKASWLSVNITSCDCIPASLMTLQRQLKRPLTAASPIDWVSWQVSPSPGPPARSRATSHKVSSWDNFSSDTSSKKIDSHNFAQNHRQLFASKAPLAI